MIEREKADVSVGIVHSATPGRASDRTAFFAKSRLPLQKWLLFLYLWVRQYSVIHVTWLWRSRGWRPHCKWYIPVVARGVLQETHHWPTNNYSGWSTEIVQIDESLFRHKPKVRYFHDKNTYIKKSYTDNITMTEQQLKRCGYLKWSTHHSHCNGPQGSCL